MGILAVGMACFFVGVQVPSETAPNPRLGNWLAAATGVTWALTVLGLRWQGMKEEGAAGAVLAGSLLAFLSSLPMSLPVQSVTPLDLGIVFYLGVFQIGLAYVFVVRAVPHLPALETVLLLLVEPVLNPVWAYFFHGEVPGTWALFGGVVILSATIIRTFSERNDPSH